MSLDNNKDIYKMMNVVLCFCARNCGKYLPYIIKNIERVKTLDINVTCVFVYDNCSDNTEDILRKYKNKSENVILSHISNDSPLRTVRIAKARNECLNIIYNQLGNVDFHIMIDCDDISMPKWNIKLLEKYLNNFDNDDWDCISFNKKLYYDIWALSYCNFRENCWAFGSESKKIVKILEKDIKNKLKNSITNSIEVFSAFCGFAIYKTDKFKGIYYDGTYDKFKKLINEQDTQISIDYLRKNNVNAVLNNVTVGNTDECCEHLFYHLSARERGLKIKISKFIMI